MAKFEVQEFEGVEFCTGNLQKAMERMPEVWERVLWWQAEVQNFFKIANSRVSLVTRIDNPFSEFQIHVQSKRIGINGNKTDVNVFRELRGEIPDGVPVVHYVVEFMGSNYIDVVYWYPECGFAIQDNKRKIYWEAETFDEAMILISGDYERIWDDLLKSVPFFIAAKHDALHKIENDLT